MRLPPHVPKGQNEQQALRKLRTYRSHRHEHRRLCYGTGREDPGQGLHPQPGTHGRGPDVFTGRRQAGARSLPRRSKGRRGSRHQEWRVRCEDDAEDRHRSHEQQVDQLLRELVHMGARRWQHCHLPLRWKPRRWW